MRKNMVNNDHIVIISNDTSTVILDSSITSSSSSTSNETMKVQQQHHDPLSTTTATHNNNDQHRNHLLSSSQQQLSSSHSSHWIDEGRRRIRSDRVIRKMNFLTAMAAIGGFLFGYDTGVISGAMLPIRRYFHLNHYQQEVVVSSTVFAAFISSIIGGIINTRYGRRNTIRIASIIFTIGSFILFIAWNYEILIFGRIIVGIGIGLASLTTPIYIAEVATPTLRGKLVTINAFMVTFGQFVAGMIDGIFVEIMSESISWRYMLGLGAIPSIIMFIGFQFYLPESPRWLIMSTTNQTNDALIILKTIRETDQDAIDEINEILLSIGKQKLPIEEDTISSLINNNENDINNNKHELGEVNAYDSKRDVIQNLNDDNDISIQQNVSSSYSSDNLQIPNTNDFDNDDDIMINDGIINNDTSTLVRFRSMLSDIPTRRALTLGCGLMIIQQWSGVNTVMYYAASIYEMSQFDERTSIWLSGFTALAQVIGVAASIYLVDRVGRRILVLVSLSLVFVSLVGLGFTFYVARVMSDTVQSAKGPCQQLSSTIVWNGITSYCYDCANMDGCGFCNGICLPGDDDGPFLASNCPVESTWIYQHCDNPFGWLSVFFMVLYLLAFGIGMGGLPWTINSEIYSLQYRSLAVSCSTATNWISNLSVAATFLSISKPSALTAYGAFWMYSLVALFGCVWLYYCLPETKGLALEDIQRLFLGHNPGNLTTGYDVVGSIDLGESNDIDEGHDQRPRNVDNEMQST